VICGGDEPDRVTATADLVRAHGWSVLWIGGGSVDFAYTVGLWHTFRRPELVMFGLTGRDMQNWLNTCVDRAGEHGWPEPHTPFGGVLEGFETQLRPVHESWHDPLFGTASRFYNGVTVPFLQLVWPDRTGTWPWLDGATASSRNRQAFAWLPVAEHPPGGWRLVGEMEPGFPFPSGPDSWALTTRQVLDGERPVALIARLDGAYDVLDERGYDADDFCLAFLGELVRRQPSLVDCADLADGEVGTIGGARTGASRRERRSSKRLWTSVEPVG
jgi:hypothetical protein